MKVAFMPAEREIPKSVILKISWPASVNVATWLDNLLVR
jgi:hypothetical protein